MSDEEVINDNVAEVDFGEVNDSQGTESFTAENQQKNLEMIYDIPLHVTARLGETRISIKELLTLGPGAVVRLDRLAGQSVDLLVNGIVVGKGDVVVVEDHFGLRVTEIMDPKDRLKTL